MLLFGGSGGEYHRRERKATHRLASSSLSFYNCHQHQDIVERERESLPRQFNHSA